MPRVYDKNLNSRRCFGGKDTACEEVRIGGRAPGCCGALSERVAYFAPAVTIPAEIRALFWCVPPNFVYKYSACIKRMATWLSSRSRRRRRKPPRRTIRAGAKTVALALIRSPPNRTCANGDNLPRERYVNLGPNK